MTPPTVAKFGGTSLADAAGFKAVKEIVESDPARRIVVASAPGKRHEKDHKVTDLLLMCHQLAGHSIDPGDIFEMVSARFLAIRDELGLSVDVESELAAVRSAISDGESEDYVASRGEYLNAKLLAEHLGYEFQDAVDVIALNLAGHCDCGETARRLAQDSTDARRVIPGFYGLDTEGAVRTFSRGGSDITGAVIAAHVDARLYENWTDVPGFLQVDPRIVADAKPIGKVTYRELRELSYMGAAVLHDEAIFPVREKGIPIQILNTRSPRDPGTLIVPDDSVDGFSGITGFAGMRDFTVITVEKALMEGVPGVLRKLVSVFETNGVSISHVPSGIDSVSVVVRSADIRFNQEKILTELNIYCQPDSVHVLPGLSVIAIVGRGMGRTPGVGAAAFSALADANVNVRMISQGTSELSIIIGVEDAQFEEAIRALHERLAK